MHIASTAQQSSQFGRGRAVAALLCRVSSTVYAQYSCSWCMHHAAVVVNGAAVVVLVTLQMLPSALVWGGIALGIQPRTQMGAYLPRILASSDRIQSTASPIPATTVDAPLISSPSLYTPVLTSTPFQEVVEPI